MRARLRKPGWMDLIESEFYLYSDAWNGMNICLFPNCCEKSSTCFCTNEYRSIFIIPESSPNPNPFQSNECRDNTKWTVCVVSIPAFPGTWCWAWWEGTSGIQSSRRWRCTRLDIGKGSWEYNTAVAGPWERTAHIGAGQFQEDERKCTLCTVHIHKFTRWRYVEALGEVNGAIQYCVSWCLNIFIMTCHWTEWLCSRNVQMLRSKINLEVQIEFRDTQVCQTDRTWFLSSSQSLYSCSPCSWKVTMTKPTNIFIMKKAIRMR